MYEYSSKLYDWDFSDSNLEGCDLEIRTMIENEESCKEAMKIGSFLNLFLILLYHDCVSSQT